MTYTRLAFILSLGAAIAAPLGAQSEPTIDPGMSRDQVIERLGKPLNERKTGASWFMFYRNGCEKSCGMNDLVILEDDKVVDAIFRSPSRHYSVASSSPTGVRPERNAGDASSAGAVDRVRKSGRGGLVIAAPSDAQDQGRPKATVTGVDVSGAAADTPATGSPDAAAASPRTTSQRTIIPVPLPGAKINPADSVRALTPDRPTALPGAKINPADSVRAEAIRKQQADTTKKPD